MARLSRCARISIFSLPRVGTAAVGSVLVQTIISAQGRVAFTAAIRDSGYDKTGKLILTTTGVYAVRSDGSTVRARDVMRPDKSGLVRQRKILDLARAEEVGVDELTQSVTTMPLRPDNMEFYARPAGKCASQDPSARGNILGFDVVREIQELGNQTARTFRKELWRASALDCFPLKETLVVGPANGAWHSTTVHEVFEVTMGEPSGSLFEKPPGYVERSP